MNRLPGPSAAVMFLICGLLSATAAVLTQIPVQNFGGETTSWMLMPMVSYRESDGQMHVTMPAAVPQLTPLLVSNPADNFNPADPWFGALDPSQGGASFSSRYGFVMDGDTDPLPSGTEMWIRKLSGPEALKFYRYSSSVPRRFEPIFGTHSVTNAIHWNGMMFHPVVAAPPGTNICTAEFEVYLINTTTGEAVPGSSSGVLAFHWTNVSDGRPELSIAEGATLTWPAGTATNWLIESTVSLNAGPWTSLTNPPVTLGDTRGVILDTAGSQRFFRMRYVP
ncbi:MAG TPA: hypothetical protein VEH04_16585 [Verrucomicrobiae bacterium]|nr:hypothetical protein [Verrucomicrobiae bacterium]